MMGLAQIRQASDEATARAIKTNKRPYVLFDRDDVLRMPGGKEWNGKRVFPFPNLGHWVPPDWTDTEERLFVDATGYGSPHEAAMTWQQLNQALLTIVDDPRRLGIGICESGQFQLYLAIYERENKNLGCRPWPTEPLT